MAGKYTWNFMESKRGAVVSMRTTGGWIPGIVDGGLFAIVLNMEKEEDQELAAIAESLGAKIVKRHMSRETLMEWQTEDELEYAIEEFFSAWAFGRAMAGVYRKVL